MKNKRYIVFFIFVLTLIVSVYQFGRRIQSEKIYFRYLKNIKCEYEKQIEKRNSAYYMLKEDIILNFQNNGLPLCLNEIIYDFFDNLKSRTKGYASLDYEFKEYKRSSLVKLDIYINGEIVDALSFIVHKDSAYDRELTRISTPIRMPNTLLHLSFGRSNGRKRQYSLASFCSLESRHFSVTHLSIKTSQAFFSLSLAFMP